MAGELGHDVVSLSIPNKDTAQEIESPLLNRRQLLKSVLAYTVLETGCAHIEAPEGHSEKLSPGRKLFLRNLRRDAIREETEKIHYLITKEYGEEVLINPPDQNGKTFGSYSFDILIQNFEQNARDITFGHTHSFKNWSNFNNPQLIEEIHQNPLAKIESDELPYNPTSFTDIFGAYKTRKKIKEKVPHNYNDSKLTFEAGDGSGVWAYDARLDNAFLQDVDTHSARIGDLWTDYSRDPAVIAYIQQHPNLDPRLVFMNTVPDLSVQSKLSNQTKDVQKELLKEAESLMSGPYGNIISIERSYNPDFQSNPLEKQRETIKAWQKAYRDVGVTVTFTPYKEFLGKS